MRPAEEKPVSFASGRVLLKDPGHTCILAQTCYAVYPQQVHALFNLEPHPKQEQSRLLRSKVWLL